MRQILGYTLPAFPGGVNYIDATDQLPETDAAELINLYPSGQTLELRKGLETSWTAASAPAYTAANLALADGTSQVVIGSNLSLYKKNGATSTAIKGASTITSNEWQHTTFNNRLYLCNGVDNAQIYTGSGNAADISFTGVATPSIATLISVTSYKERIYFIQKNTTKVWYPSSVKAIGTVDLVEFDFSFNLKLGGFLVQHGSWSSNIGTTTNDLFYVLSSEGELLFYSGLFPGDSSWQIVARYVIGRPLGYRAKVHVENDLWIITDRGIVPASMLFQTSGSAAVNSVSRKINKCIEAAATNTTFSYLYAAIYNSKDRQVTINLPITNTNTKQIVYNIETNAWTVYQYAVAGACLSMTMSASTIFYGSNSGKVYAANTGYSDDDLPIQFSLRGGFNFFQRRGMFKKFVDIRPIIKTIAGDLTLRVDVDTDFRRSIGYATITAPDLGDIGAAEWDTSAWDVDNWAEDTLYLFQRYSLRGQGHCGALRISGSMLDAPLEFNAFEIRFEEGGQT